MEFHLISTIPLCVICAMTHNVNQFFFFILTGLSPFCLLYPTKNYIQRAPILRFNKKISHFSSEFAVVRALFK